MGYAIRLLVLLGGLLAILPGTTFAQAPNKTKHVGYLVWSSYGPRGHLERALLDGMRDEGYLEGKNLVVERRYIDGSVDQVRAAAGELAALKLDAIVSTCSDSTAAAKQATANSSIPVVMAYVSDPVGQGLIASYSRPGGNVTGVASQAEDTLPKMLQYLSEVVPAGTRVTVLYHAGNPAHPRLWQRLESAAKERGISLVRLDVSKGADLGPAFDTIGRERLRAVLVLPDDNMTYNQRGQLIELVQKQRIPVIFGAREFVDIGGLMSYGPSLAANYRHTAAYLDKVLTGSRPGDLPVEQPTQFELVINLRAAKALGLTIPQPLMLRADDVIQ